jgi:hypothetical protein
MPVEKMFGDWAEESEKLKGQTRKYGQTRLLPGSTDYNLQPSFVQFKDSKIIQV